MLFDSGLCKTIIL